MYKNQTNYDTKSGRKEIRTGEYKNKLIFKKISVLK